MRKSLLSLFFFTLIFISCKENEPTAPEEAKPAGELAAEAIIGIDGGTLETEDFKLTVPGGAFNLSEELKLYIEDKDSSNENSVTPLYSIEGIPEYYSQPIEIRVKYLGTLSGITYIESGTYAEIMDFDTTYSDYLYELLDAVDDNGFLKAKIQENPGGGIHSLRKTKNEKNKVTIEGFINGSLESSEHFKIKSVDYPLDQWSSQYQAVLNTFETIYSRFNSLGLKLSDTKWPKTITIHKKFVGWALPVQVSKNKSDLTIYTFPNLNISEHLAICELAMAQIILPTYKTAIEHKWFFRGIAYWLMNKYDYWTKPAELSHVKKTLKKTLQGEENERFVHCSMEYLVNTFGQGIIKEIIEKIEHNDIKPILAMISGDRQPEKWLTQFHKSILLSDTWNNRIRHHDPTLSIIDICQENWSAEFGIEDTTTVIKWTEIYKDLSGKLYRVNLLPGLNEESGLKFTINGEDAEISLFKYKGSEIEFITSSEKSDSVSNIKNLADNGYQLIVLVSNRMPNYPNFTNSNIELKIEHKNVKPLPKITSCAISLLDIDVNIRKYWEDGTSTDDVYERFWTYFGTEGEPANEPTFENNIFSQAYTYTDDQGFKVMGNMSIEFNKNLDSILTFSAQYNVDKTVVNPLYGTLEKSISGKNIPLIPSYYNDEYSVIGLEVCEALNNLKNKSTGGGGVDWDIVSIRECRPDSDQWPSSLKIKITKE